ncbi:Evolutionarily conserved signaling intermediate in Toll pathway, mitochondrial [Eumeta japonica]|uniref:Evolutionarily conserved signaling intermediate in Toll pathway, mitochondrial n=1 Tax=Eumeta variegata TaxID=151549 RepID=A0A4C1U4M1_EUMVA|nr:Evolutionarily conserved signaling intermediate in Toll pathway, mitochondrial [Eumeta japonica]
MATKLLQFLTSRPSSIIIRRWAQSDSEKRLVVFDPFTNIKKKDKKTYLDLIKIFEEKDNRRRGHVEFIYAALNRMEEFGVHKDLETYKSLLNVLPKGKFIPTNIFQAEFLHYPKQQQCAVDLLEQMEDNRVMPDFEMEQILLNTFGRRGIPLRKFWRMMYWMPKFKNLSPWHLPNELPKDAMELAMLAIQRITSVDADTKVQLWQTDEIEASLDKTWIVTAQSPSQKVLLEEQPVDEALVIKGPYRVYLRDQSVTYFILLGKTRQEEVDDRDIDDVSNLEKPIGIPGMTGTPKLPVVKCTVHEQDDGTVVAVCATGTSSRDSLLSWIRLLEKNGNPQLANIPVIFTLRSPSMDLSVLESQPTVKEESSFKERE